MASRNGRPAERLQILNEASGSLMSKLHRVEQRLGNKDFSKDMPWVNPNMKKVVMCLQRKFPEYPSLSEVDKMQGPGDLQMQAKQVCHQLEDMYLALQDSVEFIEEAWKLLTEIADDYLSPPFEDLPEVSAAYLDLFCAYVQTILALSQVPDKEMLACFYAYCFQYASGTADVSFTKLAHMLDDTCKDRPTALAAVRKNCLEVPEGTQLRQVAVIDYITRLMMGSEAGGAGCGVFGGFTVVNSIEVVRGTDILDVLARPDEAELPSGVAPNSEIYRTLPMLQGMSTWVVYVVLACPDILFRTDGGVVLMQAAVGLGCFHQARHVQVNIHSELYEVMHDKAWIACFEEKRTKKGFKEAKEAFKKEVEECVSKALTEHAGRRTYLERWIRSIHNHCADCPGLFGPHWPLIMVAVSLARRELLWYLWHQKPLPKTDKVYKSVAKLWSPPAGADASFASLFDAAKGLSDLAAKFESVASDYHIAYLKDVHGGLLKEMVDKCRQSLQSTLKEPKALSLLDSICDRVLVADPIDMGGVSLDCKRVTFAILRSLAHPSLDPATKALVLRLHKIQLSAECVGRPGEALLEAGGVHEAGFCTKELGETLEALLGLNPSLASKGVPSQPALAAKLLPMFDAFTTSVCHSTEEEVASVGKEAARMARVCLDKVCFAACGLVREITYESSRTDIVGGPARYGTEQVQTSQAGQLWKLMDSPGSAFGGASRAHDKLAEVCATLSIEHSVVRVYDTQLHGKGVLTEALRKDFGEFLRDSMWGRGQPRVEPVAPSVVCEAVERYKMAMSVVEEYAGVAVVDVTEPVLKRMLVDPTSRPIGSRFSMDAGQLNESYETNALAMWYVRQLTRQGVYFSTTQRAFFSKHARLEAYTSIKELRSLCSLLGPSGIRTMEHTLVKECLMLVKSFHAFLQINAGKLKTISDDNASRTDASVLSRLAGLSQLEDAAQAMLGLGSLFLFRQELRNALSSVLSPTTIPQAFSAAVAATPQAVAPEASAPLHAFAHDCGVSPPEWPVDVALKEALTADLGPLSAGAVKKGDWQHVIYAVVSLLYANCVQGEYAPRREALLTNSHLLPAPMVALLALVVGDAEVGTQGGKLERALSDVVRLSSRAVFGMVGTGGKLEKDKGAKRQGAFVLLECFVREVERFAPCARHHAVPYSLTRAEKLDHLQTAASGVDTYDDDEDEL